MLNDLTKEGADKAGDELVGAVFVSGKDMIEGYEAEMNAVAMRYPRIVEHVLRARVELLGRIHECSPEEARTLCDWLAFGILQAVWLLEWANDTKDARRAK